MWVFYTASWSPERVSKLDSFFWFPSIYHYYLSGIMRGLTAALWHAVVLRLWECCGILCHNYSLSGLMWVKCVVQIRVSMCAWLPRNANPLNATQRHKHTQTASWNTRCVTESGSAYMTGALVIYEHMSTSTHRYCHVYTLKSLLYCCCMPFYFKTGWFLNYRFLNTPKTLSQVKWIWLLQYTLKNNTGIYGNLSNF